MDIILLQEVKFKDISAKNVTIILIKTIDQNKVCVKKIFFSEPLIKTKVEPLIKTK